MQWTPLWPGWLLLVVAGAILLAIVHGALTLRRKQVPPRWNAIVSGLRVLAWLLFIAIVLQPALSYSRTAAGKPELAVLVDTSASMRDRLPPLLESLRSGAFATALGERYRPRWLSVAETTRPLADLRGLEATGATTRLAEGLREAARLAQAEGKPLGRVLLVTDGQERGPGDLVEFARQEGIALDILPAADAGKQPEAVLTLADVQGSRRALLGSETHFRVTLRGPALGQAQKRSVIVLEDGKKVLDVAVTVPAGAVEHAVTLAHRPASAGLKEYRFHLDGAEAASRTLPVHIQDSKFEILVLEDTWRWQYKYLHRLFEDDPSFRFTAFLARGSGAFVQFGSPDRRINLVGFPQSRSELEAFDLIFLGDVNPARWPQGFGANLAHLVAEQGKSLVVVAGPNLGKIAEDADVEALLPVELTRDAGKPVLGPITVQLRGDAAASPFFFQLGAVEGLPPLDQVYPALRKRPGATILAEAAKHRNPYGPLIVLAEHTVGRGRVLFVGSDVLWKWHTLAPNPDGATPHALFWQQALRTLTPERLRLGSTNLWLTASRTRATVGQTVTLTADLQADRPLVSPKLQASALLPDGARLPLTFTPDARTPGRFHATLVAARAGTLQIAASVSADGKPAAEGGAVVQVVEPTPESTDEPVDHAALQRVCDATGGRLIDPARPDTWPDPSAGVLPSRVEQRTVPLWDNFTLLLLLCGVLGLDWFLRMKQGLT